MPRRNWLFTGTWFPSWDCDLFLGVSFLLKYVSAQVTVPIELRLAGIALADIALLAWAWRIRIKRPGISLPLQGTALAILMLVTFGAFRLYELIPAGLAFAVLFVLTAFTCLLAVLQNAVWLAVFGIVGGLPCPCSCRQAAATISAFQLLRAAQCGRLRHRPETRLARPEWLSFGFTFVVAPPGACCATHRAHLSTQLF